MRVVDNIKGRVVVLRGNAKVLVGRVTGNSKLQAEGRADQAGSRVGRLLARVKPAVSRVQPVVTKVRGVLRRT